MDKFRRRSTAAAVLDWLTSSLASNGEPILIGGRWLPGGGTIGFGAVRRPPVPAAPVRHCLVHRLLLCVRMRRCSATSAVS